jgi:hypothetical protein
MTNKGWAGVTGGASQRQNRNGIKIGRDVAMGEKAGKPVRTGHDEQWLRIRAQLQAKLGSEVFNSWFGRVQLESVSGGIALHSVPTAFLKSWLYSHYRDVLLELWQNEDASVLRADIAVRSAVRRSQIQLVGTRARHRFHVQWKHQRHRSRASRWFPFAARASR